MPQFLNDKERLEDVNSDFELQGPILWLGVDEDDVTDQDSSTANIILREYLPGKGSFKNDGMQIWPFDPTPLPPYFFLSPFLQNFFLC